MNGGEGYIIKTYFFVHFDVKYTTVLLFYNNSYEFVRVWSYNLETS